MVRMSFGRMAGTKTEVCLAYNASNKHVAFIGASGGGKTTGATMSIDSIIKAGASVCGIDYSGSLNNVTDSDTVRRIKVREVGIPISLLTPIKRPDGSEEDVADIADGIVDIFSDVAPIGARQRAAIRKAVLEAYKNGYKDANEFQAIGDALAMDDSPPSVSVYDRFRNLFEKVKTGAKVKLFEPGIFTIIDLTGFAVRTQRILAELVLAILWRYFRIWGQDMEHDMYVFCDEFQVLSLREDGILSQILREGRKFHLALILATQTLESFNKSERAVIQQTATQLFFRPATSEINSVLKWIGAEKSPEMRKLLANLDIGECIAVGKFDVGGIKMERPIKVTFRTDKR